MGGFWLVLAVVVAAVDVLADAGFGALSSFVGSFQPQVEHLRGVGDGVTLDGGQGEELAVVVAEGRAAVGHVGAQRVEGGVQFTGRYDWPDCLGVGGSRAVEMAAPLHSGVADTAVDQPAAEIREIEGDGPQPPLETDDQVVVDVEEFVAVLDGQMVAVGA